MKENDLIRQSCGEASPDGEVFAGLNTVPSAPSYLYDLANVLARRLDGIDADLTPGRASTAYYEGVAAAVMRGLLAIIGEVCKSAYHDTDGSDWDRGWQAGFDHLWSLLHDIASGSEDERSCISFGTAPSGNTNPSECSAGTARTADAIPEGTK